MKRIFISFSLLSIIVVLPITAQTNWCGLTDENAESIRERIARYHQMNVPTNHLRVATTYLPVRFFLVAKSDGSDRVPVHKALDALCRMNEEFEPHEIQFFIKEFKRPDNDDIHGDPNSNDGRAAIRDLMVYDAINIFLVEDISNGIAAYFQPPQGPGGNDWIVSAAVYADDEKTLPHETGHFLDLLHPHAGWECMAYDEDVHGNPVTVTENCGAEIELVNGSNCETAGDMICDTPADYGFWSESNCNWSLQIFDFNNDPLNPMLENIMGYYGGCNDYVFTDGQESVMYNSLSSSERAYIPQDITPNTDEVNGIPTQITPGNIEEVDFFNSVYFEWAAVDGATDYLLEILLPGSKANSYVTSNTSITITSLLPDETYFWKVRAFNEYSTCTGFSAQRILKTGDVAVSAKEEQLLNSWTVQPNPISQNQTLKIEWPQTVKPATVQLKSITGQIIKEQEWKGGTLEWPMDGLVSGIYFMVLKTEYGMSGKKILVQ